MVAVAERARRSAETRRVRWFMVLSFNKLVGEPQQTAGPSLQILGSPRHFLRGDHLRPNI
jgi:hypothetical protein